MAIPGAQVGEFGLARKSLEAWWEMLRALRGGTRAMRDAGIKLLPMDWMEVLNVDPSKPRYQERLERTFLFPGYDDSIRRIATRPFQKAIEVTPPEELPAELGKLEEDCDRQNTSLTVFGSQLMADLADRGLCVFIVDHVPVPEDEVVDDAGKPVMDKGKPLTQKRNMSLAEREDEGVRPYFARIVPDNLVGWRDEDIGGRREIVGLRVRSFETRQSDTDFSETRYERITVWTSTTIEVWEKPLETTTMDPQERDRILGEGKQGHKLVEGPKPHNFPGNRIPIVVVYADKIATLLAQPPLLDLAYLNVQHWQSSSQQAHILHYARAPILAAKGMDKEQAEKAFRLGAGSTVVSSNPDFAMTYVEPGGTSLEAGRKDIQDIEARMHALGMAPLTETDGPATATGEVRAENKNQAATMQWVEALEWGLFEGYKLAAEWVRQTLPEDFVVRIWRDFTITQRSQQDLTTLDSARTRKDISQETYLEEIKKRGVIDETVDVQEEMERIEAEGPSLEEMQAQIAPFGKEPAGDGEESEDEAMPPGLPPKAPPQRMPAGMKT